LTQYLIYSEADLYFLPSNLHHYFLLFQMPRYQSKLLFYQLLLLITISDHKNKYDLLTLFYLLCLFYILIALIIFQTDLLSSDNPAFIFKYYFIIFSFFKD